MPLALLASGAAAAMLTLLWRDASRYRPADASAAATMAESTLQRVGYGWAEASVNGKTLHLIGNAPDDNARVMAYFLTRRILRPMMGVDASVDEISSELTVNSGSETPNLSRVAGAPSLDVARIVPPPMPLVRLPVQEPAPAKVSAAPAIATPVPETPKAIAAKPHDDDASGFVSKPQSAVTPSAPARVMAAAPAATAPAPTRPVAVAQLNPAPAPAVATASPAVQPAVQAITPAAKPVARVTIETASLDKHQAQAAQSAGACAQTFSNTLSTASIGFGPDSATIDKESRPLLNELAVIAKQCKGYRLVVEGHTDLTGTSAHNLALSRKRAEAVRWALVDRGVDMDHISAEGYGSSRPLERSTSNAANARNRRIEINVVGRR